MAAENLCSLGEWLPEAVQNHLFLFVYMFPYAGQKREAGKRDCTLVLIYQSRHLFWEICDLLYVSNSPVSARDRGVDKLGG